MHKGKTEDFLGHEDHQALANMCKADVPVRKSRIVTMQSLMDNKGSGGRESACPLSHKSGVSKNVPQPYNRQR